jgi:hypothetical protein
MDMFSTDAPEVPARKAETDDVFDGLEIREADRTVDFNPGLLCLFEVRILPLALMAARRLTVTLSPFARMSRSAILPRQPQSRVTNGRLW